ncbi:hypothetical protein EGW08_010796, partial [Elysia chlorotica]
MCSASDIPAGWISQAFTYLALTTSVALLVRYLVTSRLPANIPPFPARAYPVLGHLPYFRDGLREQMAKWTKSAGGMFSLYFGTQFVVILGSHDALYTAFAKHGDTLSDRPESLASVSGGEASNKGLIFSSGPLWKEQRSVALQILKTFGVGKNVLALKIMEEASAFLNALSELRGEPRNAIPMVKVAVANNICSIAVGQRFEYDDARILSLNDKLGEMFRLSESSSIITAFPWLHSLPGDLFNVKRRVQLYKDIVENV